MDDLAIARAIHVLGVVIWIGGVAFITTILLPAIARFRTAEERIDFFNEIERRFVWHARVTTLLVGLSGFYMVYELDLWRRFRLAEFWWMHAMVGVWLIFSLVLFVLEPLFLHHFYRERAKQRPEAVFALIQRLHWVLLLISLITIFGAVAGAHGLGWFG